MDLNKFTELTGVQIPAGQEAKYTAVIRRTKSVLESMLGYSLKPKNLYTEKGKVQFEGFIPIEDFDVLLPPDEEEGTYKLFPFKENDKFFHIDPYTNVYKVKLVVPANDGEFITILDLDNVVSNRSRDGIGKYVERYWKWFTWQWFDTWRLRYYNASGQQGLMLAVEADWLKCYPDDLMYVWADMVLYYTNPSYSIVGNIATESVDGHSWSRVNRASATGALAPEYQVENVQILQRYAGPFSSIVRNPV